MRWEKKRWLWDILNPARILGTSLNFLTGAQQKANKPPNVYLNKVNIPIPRITRNEISAGDETMLARERSQHCAPAKSEADWITFPKRWSLVGPVA